ncbi:hypothetical protein TVAG_023180 [Trichomonas vaginalis G3]|uniref:receptor protein-tyrosine kinase n=1 Tax=Trichomonas vaginalis (strain ATCC PRA-98 / G3) TaxID=412133 RepID=A2G8X1_TRIV3|nr:hypothetical protein TVAG_023180 [Trichomonas vaginalis G3]|eukprot:XP_001299322.1 hypothetical protein [Trichomonas vaginalis G3]
MVAGSGGGAVSNTNKFGFPGGNLTAIDNGNNVFGGTQTSGELGKGMDGIDSEINQGGSRGCGGGYKGGYHTFNKSMPKSVSFEFGGSGGSSYISGDIKIAHICSHFSTFLYVCQKIVRKISQK